jgi:lipoate-protein ligase A
MTIIYSTSNSPAFNLATEEFLFSEHHDDLLFLYVNQPSVIIGCNQAIRNEVDLEFCLQNGIQIVRRMSGGGAVYHDEGNINFCFISNRTQGNSSLDSEFLLPIIHVLNDLKIEVTPGKRKDLWLPGEYKISGTASHISKTRELHHGTILYDTDLEMLERTFASKEKDANVKAIVSVRSTVKNLRTWFEEKGQLILSSTDFFELITRKLAVFFNQEEIVVLSESESKKILQLAESKYMSNEWTYKK